MTNLHGMMRVVVNRTPGRYRKQQVVYHINGDGGPEGGLYKAALVNVRNHIAALGADNISVKVLLHGDGVTLLTMARGDVELQSAVVALKADKVSFLVCANTLRGRNIDSGSDLFDVADGDIVPSGVAELSHLQQQGYTYIKP